MACLSLARCVALVTTLMVATAEGARAQQPEAAPPAASDLAKTTQNPVGDLVSLPLQFNFFSGGPLADRTVYNLNFQPVLPLRANERWNVVARTIVPYLSIPLAGTPPNDRKTGIGDIQEQLFFTPANPGALIWGVGPVLSFPTATNDLVRTGDWAVGPTLVVLKMTGPWVLGGLMNQLWTFGGDEVGPNINAFLFQPFVNYNLPRGWSLSFAPTFTANWSAPEGEKWTVPLGLGIAKVDAIGKQPVSLALQYYRLVEHPSSTGDNQIRFAFSLLYPVARKK